WKRPTTTQATANRRHRILRVVIKLVLLLNSRRCYAQRSIAGDTVRALGRVKVIPGVPSTCERKLLLVAPDVVAHDEQPHRSTAGKLVLNSLQRVVEPLQSSNGVIQHGIFAKYDITNLPCR